MKLPGSGQSSGRGASLLLLDTIIAAALLVVILRELARSTAARSFASFASEVGRRSLHGLPENSAYLAGLALGFVAFLVLIAAGVCLVAVAQHVRAAPGRATPRR